MLTAPLVVSRRSSSIPSRQGPLREDDKNYKPAGTTTSSSDSVRVIEDPPTDLQCSITLELMEDPTMLVQSGNTYERRALLSALKARPNKDPLTNQGFRGRAVVAPNRAVKRLIEQWKEQHPQPTQNDGTIASAQVSPPSPEYYNSKKNNKTEPPMPVVTRGTNASASPRQDIRDWLSVLLDAENLNEESSTTNQTSTLSDVTLPAVRQNLDSVVGRGGSSQANSTFSLSVPADNDILFGRGRGVAARPGNIRLRQLVQEFAIHYRNASRNRDKKNIVDHIREKLSREGARFLVPGRGGSSGTYRDREYVEATPIQVHHKLSHMFREFARRIAP